MARRPARRGNRDRSTPPKASTPGPHQRPTQRLPQPARGEIFTLARGSAFNALGQLAQRSSGLILAALVARTLGPNGFGAFAVAQSASLTTVAICDSGSRQIGARLVARSGACTQEIGHTVQRVRISLMVAALAAGCIYATFTQPGYRLFVALYILGTAPYAIRLDWIAWGLSKFGRICLAQTASALIALGISSLVLLEPAAPWLTGLAVAWALGQLAAAIILWNLNPRPPQPSDASQIQRPPTPQPELALRRVFILGVGSILNRFFQSSGLLILGLISYTAVAGAYGAAYKVFALILGTFYIMTEAAYPLAARRSTGPRAARLALGAAALAALVGSIIAALLQFIGGALVAIVYGPGFGPAVAPLKVLALSLPTDMAASVLGVALVAWSKDLAVTGSFAISAAVAAILTVILAPRFAASGAAWALFAAYAALLACLVHQTARAIPPNRSPAASQAARGSAL